MVIVDANLADMASIAEIRRKAFARFAPLSYSAQEVETLLADLDEGQLRHMIEDKKMFVACEDSIVGSAGWNDDFIRHVYVDPAHTRQGIGSHLLSHAEQNYRRRTNRNEIQAGVALYAREFYEANGYAFLSEETDWDGSKYCKMRKSFAPLHLRGENHV